MFGGGVAVHGLQPTGGELRSIAVVIERIPRRGFGWLGSDALHPVVERGVGRSRHFQITRHVVEDACHIGGALNVGVAAEGIDATAGASDVAH